MLLAAATTGMVVVGIGTAAYESSVTPATSAWLDAAEVLGVALLVIGTVSLAWRKRAPLLVLGLSGCTFAGFLALGALPSPLPFAPLIAMYTVAALTPVSISRVAATALAFGFVAAALARTGPMDDDFLDYLLLGLAAWTLGYGSRLSGVRAALLEQRATQLACEQDAQTRRAVEQERARIARELHDVIVHHVSIIVAQATAYQRVADSQPGQARQALSSIETVAREALVEMRRMLGVLWTMDEDGDRTPQPGLQQLTGLIGQVQLAGLPVRLAVRGDERPLPPGVELNAYRIVQEALTNILKHAGPTSATVELDYDADRLNVRVLDEGCGSTAVVTAGRGLVGMRERAALLGGDVAAGPRPGRGFLVTAQLPTVGAPTVGERL